MVLNFSNCGDASFDKSKYLNKYWLSANYNFQEDDNQQTSKEMDREKDTFPIGFI